MFLFVSDVHLDEPHKKRYGAFLRFLKETCAAPDVEKVFLVGDIFDLWLGDRKIYVDKHKEVLEALKNLALTKEVHFFEGNHDFQLGKVWTDMGVHVHPASYEFHHKGKKFLISHGDLLNPQDKGYRLMRAFFRSGLARFLIKLLPQGVLNKIGQALTSTHMKESSELSEFEKAAFRLKWSKWTKELYLKSKFDVFICGHYHIRLNESFKDYRAINLGTWLDPSFQYLSLKEGSFSFQKV